MTTPAPRLAHPVDLAARTAAMLTAAAEADDRDAAAERYRLATVALASTVDSEVAFRGAKPIPHTPYLAAAVDEYRAARAAYLGI